MKSCCSAATGWSTLLGQTGVQGQAQHLIGALPRSIEQPCLYLCLRDLCCGRLAPAETTVVRGGKARRGRSRGLLAPFCDHPTLHSRHVCFSQLAMEQVLQAQRLNCAALTVDLEKMSRGSRQPPDCCPQLPRRLGLAQLQAQVATWLGNSRVMASVPTLFLQTVSR